MREVTLAEAVEINPDSLSTSTSGTYRFRYIDLSAVSRGWIFWDQLESHTRATAPSRAQRQVRRGDCLFGTVRPSQQSHGFIDQEAEDLVASTGFAVLRARNGITDPRFLYHWMLSRSALRQSEAMAVGSNYPAINESDVARLKLFRLPLHEQRRIAEILDSLDSHISAASLVIDKLRMMRWGIVHDTLAQGIANASKNAGGWSLKPVTEVGAVKIGRQRSPQHESGRHMTPYLRVANVYDGYIDYNDVLEMNFTPSEREEYELRDGDILLNEGQSLELVGRSAIYDGPSGYCFQNTLIRFRSHLTSPAYCQSVFSYWLAIGEFTKIAKQTTSIAHLGADRFAQMPFPVPPPDEEKSITSSINAVATTIESEAKHAFSLRLLKQGLMEDLLTGRVQVLKAEAVLENL